MTKFAAFFKGQVEKGSGIAAIVAWLGRAPSGRFPSDMAEHGRRTKSSANKKFSFHTCKLFLGT